MKFRKRPVVIEAWNINQRDEMPKEFRDCIHFEYIGNTAEGGVRYWIETLEGSMEIDFDAWIIRGIRGEFYPIKNDIFIETYEAVDTNETRREKA